MTRLAYIPNRIIDHNGIADGATVHVYLSGSTTPVLLYSNSAMTIPMANPFTVAAGASFPDVFYDSSVNIKLTIVSALDGSIEEHDPYNPLSVSVTSPIVSVKTYGAVGDGVADDYPAIAAAIAALEAQALNTGGSGFYKGSQALYAPAGTYKCSQAVDIKHTLKLYGDGSGQFGPEAGGCTRFKFPDACDGIRVQATNTSGDTTVDITTHDGAGGVVLEDFCIEGGFAGTEGEHHGLVLRQAIKSCNLYIKNFPGEGVKALAGNQTGGGTLSGNLSTTLLVGVKTEGCRGGIDIRGGDANVITTINCEGYQNRQFGLLDDNGGGSNTHIGWHCASNGIVTGTWPQTQCSYSGNHYAAKWGGDPTVAPSGTTADTANWLYIEAGAAITNLIPAWVSTANTFRAGGDYLTINSASALILNCYSETGGFSQFTPYTQIEYGSMTPKYFRGGTQQLPSGDGGRMFKSGRLSCILYLDTDAPEAGVFPRNYDGTGGFGYLDFARGGGASLNGLNGCHFLHNGVAVGTIDNTGLSGVASVSSTGAITSTGGGVGYATGAGGAVTQATSRTTGVTLNKLSGAITLFSAAGSATYATMTVTNSTVAATDTVRVCQKSGTDKYMIHVTNVGAGTFDITFATTGGTTTEQPVFNFSIIKGASA